MLLIKRKQNIQLILLILLLAVVSSEAKIGILGRFADDIVLERLSIGKTYNLRTLGNIPYRITNVGDAETDVVIEPYIPLENQLKPDYEAIPDPSWVQVIPNQFRLKPQETGIAEVILTIPPDEKYLNRHFQVGIAGKQKGTGLMATGVSHRIRFSTGMQGPETLLAEKKRKAMFSLNMEFKPTALYLDDIEPGKKIKLKKIKRKSLKVVNWSEDDITIKLTSVEYKKMHGLPSGYKPVPDPKWLIMDTKKIKLKGNEITNIELSLQIPDENEHYGKKYAFLIKVDIENADIPLEIYSKVYVLVGSK